MFTSFQSSSLNSRRQKDKSWREAFTLIELLVVIAIISILAALLLPSLSSAKMTARSAVCKSQLHQYGLALSMYIDDFGKYPLADIVPINESQPTISWKDKLGAYSSSLKLNQVTDTGLICPEPNPRTANDDYLRSLGFYSKTGCYGYNAFGSVIGGTSHGLGGLDSDPEVAASTIKSPSEMVAIGDVTGKVLWFSPIRTFEGDFEPSGRHRSGANIVFCDGHVEFDKRSQWMARTASARARWNNDHLPHIGEGATLLDR